MHYTRMQLSSCAVVPAPSFKEMKWIYGTLEQNTQEHLQIQQESKYLSYFVEDGQNLMNTGIASQAGNCKIQSLSTSTDAEHLINALICMTGWAKAYAEEKGWTNENARLIWTGIAYAESVLDKHVKHMDEI